MFRGLSELLLQPSRANGRGDGFWKSGGGTDDQSSTALLAPSVASFQASWDAYRTTNPRLRKQRVLPALCRRGVPDDLRPAVWAHCLGLDAAVGSDLPAGTSATSGCLTTEDADMPKGTAALIETDVTRTFLTCAEFQENGGQAKLRRVLRGLAAADHGIGYCQSLNFLAAMLLMVLTDEGVVVLAVRQLVVKLGTRSWYSDGMRQLRADAVVLEDLVRDRLPRVHKAFRKQKFEFVFVCSKWFLALFTTALEGETLRRVWDVMLCDGIEAVFRVAFALIDRHSLAASCAESLDDLVMLFQGRQKDCVADVLITSAYSPALIGLFGRGELSQRRIDALARVSSADMKEEMRDACLWRGGVHPPSFPKR